MKPIIFPKDFLFGSATAASQIEGNDPNTNWYHWGEQGKIDRNESPITACDHYHRYKEDIELMESLNQETYRMSIEWSRLEPKKGEWSQVGIDHYRDELELLLAKNIKPLVTLHHFSIPQWMQEEGGFLSPNSVDYFIEFTKKVVECYGDVINEYCTINEPNVFVNDTYLDGKYPPGDKGNLSGYFKASKNLMVCHLKAYVLIHKMRKEMGYSDTKVGFAHHLAYFTPKNPLLKPSRKLMDYLFHGIFFRGMVEGKIRGVKVPEAPRGGVYCDFLGINYYSRHLIVPSFDIGMLFGKITFDPSVPKNRLNDLGWEIYPKGLYKMLRRTYRKYKMPLYITENGIPDKADAKRGQFIVEHLLQVKKLLDKGVDVQRYYHWSLLDNLEWNEGYAPKFGLVEVNYETQERTPRPSAYLYSRICKEKQISEDLLRDFNIEEA